jgi:regulator of sigma E protease
MISGILIFIIAFLSLIVLMIIHEFGHFIIAKKFGVRVDEFGIFLPPRLFGIKIGETVYSLNLLPIGAFVKIYGEEGGVDDYRSFASLKIWQRVCIVIGGVAAFWIVAIIIFSIVFMIGTDLPVGEGDVQGLTNARVQIVEVAKDSPAWQSGLKVRDVVTDIIVGETYTKISKVSDFQKIANENKGKEITLVVKRGSDNLNFSLTPRLEAPPGQGSVGVGLERIATLVKRYSLDKAPLQGLIYTWQITVNTVKALYDFFGQAFGSYVLQKEAPPQGDFAGPLGITIFLANAASYGIGFFLYFIGVICVLVAVFNLFPIPALDGGKLVFLLIEKIKGRPVSVKVEQGITLAFFAILICLSIFITIKFDIPRFTEFIKSNL